MYWSAVEVADVPVDPVTVTSTVPAAAAGTIAVTCVAELIVKLAAALPKWTAVAPLKPEPLIVTEVPPAVVPDVGLRPLTTGCAP